MFKPKITVSVLLAGVVCSILFMCISEYLQGRTEWTDWLCPAVMGMIWLVFVLASRKKRKLSTFESLNEKGYC